MKRYRNILFAALTCAFIFLSFASCTNDNWVDGRMDYKSVITAAPNGLIATDLRISKDYVLLNGSYGYIDDIRFVGGYIEIEPGPHIYGFTLTLSNSNARLDVDVQNGRGGTLDGPQTQDFLNAVVEVVRRNGYATIYVDGEAQTYAQFGLDFYIDIEAYVRE